MGGKIWSRDEEVVFWTVIIPSSNKRLLMAHPGHSQNSGNQENQENQVNQENQETQETQETPRGWTQLAATMQSLMAAGARRRYTPLMLYEHFFQNAVLETFSPKARPFVQAYIAREKQATGFKPSERNAGARPRSRRARMAGAAKAASLISAADTGAETVPMLNGSYLSPELEAEVTNHLNTSPGMPGVPITVDSTTSMCSQRPLPAFDCRPRYDGSMQYSNASQPQFGLMQTHNQNQPQNSQSTQDYHAAFPNWSFPYAAAAPASQFDSTASLGQLASVAALQPAVAPGMAEAAERPFQRDAGSTTMPWIAPAGAEGSDASGQDRLFVGPWTGVEQ